MNPFIYNMTCTNKANKTYTISHEYKPLHKSVIPHGKKTGSFSSVQPLTNIEKWIISPRLEFKQKGKTQSTLTNGNVCIHLLVDFRKSYFCCLLFLPRTVFDFERISIRISSIDLTITSGIVQDSMLLVTTKAMAGFTFGSSLCSRLLILTTKAVAVCSAANSSFFICWVCCITIAPSPC